MTAAFRGPRQVRGIRLYVDYQPGEGTPLLLCNGLGTNLELMQPFVDALAAQPGRRVPVIRVDMPGSGGSASTRLPVRLPRLARLLADLVTDLGHAEVDVLGLSWGGSLAQEFARRHSRLCRRLVLCASSMGMIGVPPNPSVLLTSAGLLTFFGAVPVQQTGDRIFGGGFGDDPAVADRFAADLRAPAPVGYLWQTLAWLGWTSAHYLPLLAQPALVVAGDADPLIPAANARLMALLLRRGRLHIVRGGGHLVLLTHTAKVTPMIHAFLDAHGQEWVRTSG